MPIVFEAPGPYNASTYEAYGALQQQNANYDRMQRAQAASRLPAAPVGDFGGGGGGRGGGGELVDTRFQDQLDLQQGQLNQAENMRLSRLQQAESAIDANDTLEPDQKMELKTQLRTGPAGLDMLERRKAQAMIQHVQLQNQALERQHALSVAQENAANLMRSRAGPDGLMNYDVIPRDAVRDEVLQANPWLQEFADQPQVASRINDMVEREMHQRGGIVRGLIGADGKPVFLGGGQARGSRTPGAGGGTGAGGGGPEDVVELTERNMHDTYNKESALMLKEIEGFRDTLGEWRASAPAWAKTETGRTEELQRRVTAYVTFLQNVRQAMQRQNQPSRSLVIPEFAPPREQTPLERMSAYEAQRDAEGTGEGPEAARLPNRVDRSAAFRAQQAGGNPIDVAANQLIDQALNAPAPLMPRSREEPARPAAQRQRGEPLARDAALVDLGIAERELSRPAAGSPNAPAWMNRLIHETPGVTQERLRKLEEVRRLRAQVERGEPIYPGDIPR